MRFLSKLCLLAVLAYVSASPKIEHRVDGQSNTDWSKFLGKVPEYFKSPEGLNQLQQPSSAESNSENLIQQDSSYPGGNLNPGNNFNLGNNFNPNQISSGEWNQKFRGCMEGWSQRNPGQESNYGSSGSGSSGVGNIQNPEVYQQNFEKCRKEISQNFGNPGQDSQSYFQGFNIPQGLQNYGPSSSSSSSG